MACLLHPQLHPAGQVALRASQLVGRHRLVADARHLLENRRDRRRYPARIDPGRHHERSRVGVIDDVGTDIVGEALLLAHGLEQTAAHAVPEDGVHDLECPGLRVVSPQPGNAEAELSLGCVAPNGHDPLARRQSRCRVECRMVGVAHAESALGQRDDFLVRDVACSRHDDVAGPVGGRPKGSEVRFGQGAYALLAPRDLSTQRRVAEHREIEEGVDVLTRVVEIGPDLLDDDRSLRLDLAAAEARSDDELAEDVHAASRLAEGNAHPVDRRLAVGSGVEAAADALDRLGNGSSRRVGGRSLESDVLHEVRGARLLGRLQARSGQDVGGNGDGASPGEARRDDARPAGQRSAFVHHVNASGKGTGPDTGQMSHRRNVAAGALPGAGRTTCLGSVPDGEDPVLREVDDERDGDHGHEPVDLAPLAVDDLEQSPGDEPRSDAVRDAVGEWHDDDRHERREAVLDVGDVDVLDDREHQVADQDQGRGRRDSGDETGQRRKQDRDEEQDAGHDRREARAPAFRDARGRLDVGGVGADADEAADRRGDGVDEQDPPDAGNGAVLIGQPRLGGDACDRAHRVEEVAQHDGEDGQDCGDQGDLGEGSVQVGGAVEEAGPARRNGPLGRSRGHACDEGQGGRHDDADDQRRLDAQRVQHESLKELDLF